MTFLLKSFNFFYLLILYFISINSFAKGLSPYLPLQVDPLIELELNRLATLAKLPILTKPYHAATINNYLTKISYSHPTLYRHISTYLKRYKKEAVLTYASAEINYADTKNIPLANRRGRMADANYQGEISGFWQVNQYLIINGSGLYYEGGVYITTNTFVSIGIDVLQLDIGYREHWMPPFQDSAVLFSTQAKLPLGVTISNPSLISDFNIKYEVYLGILDEHDGIRFDRDKLNVSGEPALLTMHLSAQPFDW
jgi:hypothetical protein